MYQSTKIMFVTGAIIIGLIAGTALGDTGAGDKFWQWRDAAGIAFTDHFKQVPEMFKDHAIQRDFDRMLEKRTQMIITEKEQRERLQKQLDHLRSLNEVKSTSVKPTVIIIEVEETRRRFRRSGGPGK